MNFNEIWQLKNEIISPLSLQDSEILPFPIHPPGREMFPIWKGIVWRALCDTDVRAIASGSVLLQQPLTLLHAHNVISCYGGETATQIPSGASVKCGEVIGQIACNTQLHFEIGLSLYSPQYGLPYFMPIDPRDVIQNILPTHDYSSSSSLWRGSLPLEMIPLFLQRAIVAVEDRRFYNHIGIDVTRMAKAFLNNLRQKRIVEGASTITQQAARSALHITKRTWFRKIIEIPIALSLERFHNKDKILELYFNSIYWGRGATNVASAAVDFFGKNVWDLNLRECALLAALPNHPLGWEVNQTDIKRLEMKSEIVLSAMRQQNMIDDYILGLAQSQKYKFLK